MLTTYGWTESVESQFKSLARPGDIPARVVRVDRGKYLVATATGVERCYPSRSSPGSRTPADTPATGDWVIVRERPGLGLMLDAIFPRRSAVRRLNATSTGEQVLAANVDTIFALHGIDRPHRVGRLERLCLLSWGANTTPVIVLTKTDLLGTTTAAIDLLDAIREIGKVIRGVDVLPVSSATGEGIEQLYAYLGSGQTVGVLGESGAGKSTLINRLAGVERQVTGPTRSGDNKGRHTTTSRDLVPLRLGGTIIDTPGLRTISLLGNTSGLAHSYEDVEALFSGCRFRNCSHQAEPDCGVRTALTNGTLESSRWAAYQKLLREIAHEARRSDVRTRRAEARDGGRRTRSRRDNVEEW
jgi:ribosome biogenesis GTPase